MAKVPFRGGIGFADAQYRCFQITESDRLTVFLTSWDEREIKIEFFNTLRFSYVIGAIISEGVVFYFHAYP